MPRRRRLQATIDARRHLLDAAYHGDWKALAAFKAAAAVEGLTAPPPRTKSTPKSRCVRIPCGLGGQDVCRGELGGHVAQLLRVQTNVTLITVRRPTTQCLD